MADYQQIISSVQQVAGVGGAAVVTQGGQIAQSTLNNASANLPNVAGQIFANIGVQIKRMQRGSVRQLVLETEGGLTLISGLAQGELLVVYADVVEGFNLAQLLEVTSRF